MTTLKTDLPVQSGHHLVLGTLVDVITGQTLTDTHDERYRQKIARLLIENKGYSRDQVLPRTPLDISAGGKRARMTLDLMVFSGARAGMLIQYGPGSLVTRHRPALALAFVVKPYSVALAVVTNGRQADVLDSRSGKPIGSGLDAIPDADALQRYLQSRPAQPISASRRNMAHRVLYAYEIDGRCPCDDSACAL